MSNTTLTNIPSNLDIRVKEPSDGAQVPPSGPWSSDRFKLFEFPWFFVYSQGRYSTTTCFILHILIV